MVNVHSFLPCGLCDFFEISLLRDAKGRDFAYRGVWVEKLPYWLMMNADRCLLWVHRKSRVKAGNQVGLLFIRRVYKGAETSSILQKQVFGKG